MGNGGGKGAPRGSDPRRLQAKFEFLLDKYERIETLLYYLNNKVINVLEALFNNITFEVINKCTYIYLYYINIY
jgi:hypothetical protein